MFYFIINFDNIEINIALFLTLYIFILHSIYKILSKRYANFIKRKLEFKFKFQYQI